MTKRRDPRTSPARRKLLEDIFLQPWFLPLETAQSIRRLLPDAHNRKMRFYFDDWGCMKCEKKGLMYGANGMCRRCSQKVQHRVVCCLQKHLGATIPVVRRPESCTRVESAKLLLRDLIR
jgi:hypothetical protein